MEFVDGQTKRRTHYGVCLRSDIALSSLWSLSTDRHRVELTIEIVDGPLLSLSTDRHCVELTMRVDDRRSTTR